MTDATSGKVPVGECVAAAWRFFLANWVQFLPAATVVSIVSGLGPLIGGASPGGLLLTYAISAIAGIFFGAAVLRKAVRDEYVQPLGLVFGSDEARLVGVFLCTALLVLPAVAVFCIILFVALVGRLQAAGLDPTQSEVDVETLNKALTETLSTPIVSLSALALAIVLIYVSGRLVMVNAATIGERRIVFLQTWGWTKGNLLRVIAAMLLTAAPIVILGSVIGSIIDTSGGVPPGSPARIVTDIVLAFISTILGIPPIALGAHLYKGLRPPSFVPK